MPAADGGDEGCGGKHQRGSFRCLDAARYTVAAVVTVLIVTVIVIAMKLLLRPESLRLSVVGGAVYTTRRPAADQKAVTLALNLRAENPSGRARVYLLNVTAYLFDNATQASTPTPEDDSFTFFTLVDEAVRQQLAVDAVTSVDATEDSMDPAHLDALCAEGGGVIADAALRVDGSVVTEVRSGVNLTRLATYFCWPLLVGGKQQGGGDTRNDDVLCTEKNLARRF
ncbi:hypothetical protein BS78_10G015700 [Paspalum vaginatum]|nr:hypothetical protein BS78_10G014300 [Paspalum vaginatum]KAJ1257694.1 hypothetical protein BS78_10G015700 [Paspalum vaginatum]